MAMSIWRAKLPGRLSWQMKKVPPQPATGGAPVTPMRPPAALRGSQSVSTMPSAAGLRPSPVARLARRTCCQRSTVSSVGVTEFQAPSMRPLPVVPPVLARTAPASRLATPGSSPGIARKRSW